MRDTKKIISLFILALCVLGLFLYQNAAQTDANKRLSKEITRKVEEEERKEPEKESSPLKDPEEGKEKIEKEKDAEALYGKKLSEAQKINNETVAWLTIPGTLIDYPVVQGKDNDYYLDHNIYKVKDPVGSIYMDYENNISRENNNLILYGHSLATDNMFSDLLKFKKQSFFDENNTIYLYSSGKLKKYQAAAGFVMDLEKEDQIFHFNEFIDSNETENSKKYLEEAKRRSIVGKDIQAGEKDQLITLSTCSYEYNDARFVLVGVKQ